MIYFTHFVVISIVARYISVTLQAVSWGRYFCKIHTRTDNRNHSGRLL